MSLPLAFALFTLVPASATTPVQDRVEEWREDIYHLVEELERLHPNPFFGIPREEFEAAVDQWLERLPEVDDDEALVGLMRLVALLSREGRDGHTAVWPMGSPLLPLQLYAFSDGWFVVRAAPAQADLVGAQLLRVGDVPVEEACARIAPLLTRDNDTNLLTKIPMMLLGTRLLHGTGLSDEGSSARLAFENERGEVVEVELEGQGIQEYSRWNEFPPQSLPASESPRWLRSGGGRFWAELLDDEESLYVQYTEIQGDDGRGTTLGAFAEELVRRFEDEDLSRVIIDVRRNRGGNNTTFGPLVDALRSSAAINQRGRLFVLTGRQTFSAAGNFVTVVQARTNALLVGEATGGAPNQYGDATRVVLPHHRDLFVLVSTRYHEFGGPEDDRLTHEPDVPVPYSSADYFEGRDPVLEAAVRFAD